MLKFIKPYLSRINLIVIIVLLLIHFVIKESNYVFSLLFYTFPLPIIIIAITLLSIFQSKKIRTYNLIIVLVLSVIWIDRSFKINNPESIIDGNIEVVFWNATHKREFHHVFEEFEILPDIVVLVEYHAEGLTVAKSKYPDYFFYWHSESEIGIFSKKPIEIKNVLTSEDETVVINFNTYEMSFYAVDVSASVFVPRQQQLKFVNESIEGNKKL